MSVDRVVVLLKLKAGRAAADYERWVRSTDLPVVSRLASVVDFRVYQATGLLGGGAAPYDYIEVLDIADQETFAVDVSTPTMQRVASEFADWADATFVTTREIVA